MRIIILAVANKARGWAREAEQDFLLRLRPFVGCEVALVKPEDEVVGVEVAKKREGERLLARVPAGSFVIACDRAGKQLSSPEFAKKLGQFRDESQSICIIIGGSNGLSDEVLSQAKLKISLGTITFPHELFRIVLLEQLYRSYMILAGKRYHK